MVKRGVEDRYYRRGCVIPQLLNISLPPPLLNKSQRVVYADYRCSNAVSYRYELLFPSVIEAIVVKYSVCWSMYRKHLIY